MTSRIMVQRSGAPRPLSFDSRGESPPLLVGSATRWAGLPLEAHAIRSYEGRGESGPVDGECGLLAITEGQIELVVGRGGREHKRVARAGSTFLLSGEDRATVLRMTGPAQVVAVHLPPEWFHRLSLDRRPPGFEQTRFLADDATVISLVRAMRDEVMRGAVTGRLFADSLSTALLSYLVHSIPTSAVRVRGRLSDGECHQLKAYILDRLGEDLSLAELAARVGRRPRHFSTLFRQAFGASPHRYVLGRRLAEGARLLASGHQDVAGLALRLGFCSQSHFAAAFRSEFGTTPRRYAVEKHVAPARF